MVDGKVVGVFEGELDGFMVGRTLGLWVFVGLIEVDGVCDGAWDCVGATTVGIGVNLKVEPGNLKSSFDAVGSSFLSGSSNGDEFRSRCCLWLPFMLLPRMESPATP